ncbi:hypothetical protein [Aliarcobacter butzleri]|uniref:hypothetical protein n=1 Tax=Aliarcobacter butzleri TaxID=28197 RepID=UPI002B24F12A|nr:hypothetical protein [Aliarcobacter butzleri]
MQITIIFIGILFIVGLVYFGMKLNNYSDEKYDYTPINIYNAVIMMISFILIACGFFFLRDNEINKYLSIVFSLIIVIGNFLYIKTKTDFNVALGSIFILFFSGLLLLLLIVGSSRNNDDYYH